MKVLLALPLLALALAGCTTGSDFVTPPMEDGKYIIEMTPALTFSPSKAEVPAGATVVFRNVGASGSVFHDVHSENNDFAASPRVDPGEEWELTIDEPGDYDYYCQPHEGSGMVGTLRVV